MILGKKFNYRSNSVNVMDESSFGQDVSLYNLNFATRVDDEDIFLKELR